MPPRDSGLTHHLARLVLITFLATFVAARVMVFLIMSRRVPDRYLHVGGTHVHHLNYGIFLLSAVGAILLFVRPAGRWLDAAAVVYAVGLGLTFDEFGMWVSLGGPYWQRASFDAVVVIAAGLGLIVAAPRIRDFGARHWATAAAVVVLVAVFACLLAESFRYTDERLQPYFQRLEASQPE